MLFLRLAQIRIRRFLFLSWRKKQTCVSRVSAVIHPGGARALGQTAGVDLSRPRGAHELLGDVGHAHMTCGYVTVCEGEYLLCGRSTCNRALTPCRTPLTVHVREQAPCLLTFPTSHTSSQPPTTQRYSKTTTQTLSTHTHTHTHRDKHMRM